MKRWASALDSHTTSLSLSSSVPKPRQATGLSGDGVLGGAAAAAEAGEGGFRGEGDAIGAPLPAAGAGVPPLERSAGDGTGGMLP